MLPSSRPGVGVKARDGPGCRSTLLSRSTIREPLLLFTPVAAAKSAPSVARFRQTEHTCRADVRGKIRADAEWPHSDMGRDPKRCSLLRRLESFLRLFEKSHSGVKRGKRSRFGVKVPCLTHQRSNRHSFGPASILIDVFSYTTTLAIRWRQRRGMLRILSMRCKWSAVQYNPV